jgi:hypothetical protein
MISSGSTRHEKEQGQFRTRITAYFKIQDIQSEIDSAMKPYEATAIQWLHDEVRVYLRARREGKQPPAPGDWVGLCWDVGHSLSMMAAHGISLKPVLVAVSGKLRMEFVGVKGLLPSDFQMMRLFYLNYFERMELLPKLRLIPWDRHELILQRGKDPVQQEFYLDLCLKENLNREGLEEAFKNQRYEMSSHSAMP